MQLDRYDRSILTELQNDASLTGSELADRVGLSQSPCWRRVANLEANGLIRKRVALVDREKLGLNAQVFAQVKLSTHGRAHLSEFSEAVSDIPEIIECYVLMGSVDFMLRIVTEDINAYEALFFNTLSRLPGVQEITSTIALSEIKSTTALPMPLP